ARTMEPDASLTFFACDLWLLTSANCGEAGAHLKPGPEWQDITLPLHSFAGASRTWLGLAFAPPTPLTFPVRNAHASGVDIDAINLKTPMGRDLIQNGNFENGADHWFWTVDDHLPWHTKNFVVYLLVEQGYLGLIAVAMLLALTLWHLARHMGD